MAADGLDSASAFRLLRDTIGSGTAHNVIFIGDKKTIATVLNLYLQKVADELMEKKSGLMKLLTSSRESTQTSPFTADQLTEMPQSRRFVYSSNSSSNKVKFTKFTINFSVLDMKTPLETRRRVYAQSCWDLVYLFVHLNSRQSVNQVVRDWYPELRAFVAKPRVLIGLETPHQGIVIGRKRKTDETFVTPYQVVCCSERIYAIDYVHIKSSNLNSLQDLFSEKCINLWKDPTPIRSWILSKQFESRKPLFYERIINQKSEHGMYYIDFSDFKPPPDDVESFLSGENTKQQPCFALPFDGFVSKIPKNLLTVGTRQLSFFNCKLTSFNASKLSIEYLWYINVLVLMNNDITTMNVSGSLDKPKAMGLLNLRELYCCSNKLYKLPSDIASIPNLAILDLRKNKFTSFPIVVCGCKNLKKLDLGDNQIPSIAPEIGKLTTLKELYVNNNNISNLPVEIGRLFNLKILMVQNNNIHKLPLIMANLTKLHTLELSGNPLVEPSPEILAGGLDSMRSFMSDQLRSGERSFRMKLMFVGQENVGKTSVVRAIKRAISSQVNSNNSSSSISQTNNTHFGHGNNSNSISSNTSAPNHSFASSGTAYNNGNINNNNINNNTNTNNNGDIKPPLSTDGIDIETLTMQHVDQSGTSDNRHVLQFTVLDFAGQEVYHSTHQVFLTERAIYMVVWDLRRTPKECKLDYWLHAITAAAPKSPIFLVGTHLDDKFVDPKKCLANIEALIPEYKKKFRIRGLEMVSCTAGENISAMVRNICNAAMREPTMGAKFPTSHFLFEEHLQIRKNQLKEANKAPVLTYEEIKNLAIDCGVIGNKSVLSNSENPSILPRIRSNTYVPKSSRLRANPRRNRVDPNSAQNVPQNAPRNTSNNSNNQTTKPTSKSASQNGESTTSNQASNDTIATTTPTLSQSSSTSLDSACSTSLDSASTSASPSPIASKTSKSSLFGDINSPTNSNPTNNSTNSNINTNIADSNTDDEESILHHTLTLFHELGSIVYLGDHLDAFIILDPQWITKVFASILTTKHNFAKDGMLDYDAVVTHLWGKNTEFPAHLHPIMLDLLEHFQCVFKMPDFETSSKLLVPLFLSDRRPDLSLDWPAILPGVTQYTRLYDMGYTPVGLIGRILITLMQESVVQKFWKTGMLLYSKQYSQHSALIELVEAPPTQSNLNIQSNTNNDTSNSNLASSHQMGSPTTPGKLHYRLSVSVRGIHCEDLFRTLVAVVDYICSAWYHLDSTHDMLIKSSYCPTCIAQGLPNPTEFTTRRCEACLASGNIVCTRNPDDWHVVRVDQVAPDIAFADFESKIVDFQSEVVIVSELGTGSNGPVYKATFNSEYVVVKNCANFMDFGVQAVSSASQSSNSQSNTQSNSPSSSSQPSSNSQPSNSASSRLSSMQPNNSSQVLLPRISTYFSTPLSLPVMSVAAVSEAMEELKKEVQLLSSLKHPNLVQIVGISLTKPPTLLLEYVASGNLAKFISSPQFSHSSSRMSNNNTNSNVTGTTSWTTSNPSTSNHPISNTLTSHPSTTSPTTERWSLMLRIAWDVAQGLNSLHSSSIIHGSLSHRKVFITSNNSLAPVVAKVSFIGNFHAIQDVESLALLPWTDPFVLQGNKPTAASDVYSFGIILWQISTLLTPFSNELDAKELKSKILAGHRPDCSSFPLGPDGHPCTLIIDLIQQCWEPEPSKRPTFSSILNDSLPVILKKYCPDVFETCEQLQAQLESSRKAQEALSLGQDNAKSPSGNVQDLVLGRWIINLDIANSRVRKMLHVQPLNEVWCLTDLGHILVFSVDSGQFIRRHNHVLPSISSFAFCSLFYSDGNVWVTSNKVIAKISNIKAISAANGTNQSNTKISSNDDSIYGSPVEGILSIKDAHYTKRAGWCRLANGVLHFYKRQGEIMPWMVANIADIDKIEPYFQGHTTFVMVMKDKQIFMGGGRNATLPWQEIITKQKNILSTSDPRLLGDAISQPMFYCSVDQRMWAVKVVDNIAWILLNDRRLVRWDLDKPAPTGYIDLSNYMKHKDIGGVSAQKPVATMVLVTLPVSEQSNSNSTTQSSSAVSQSSTKKYLWVALQSDIIRISIPDGIVLDSLHAPQGDISIITFHPAKNEVWTYSLGMLRIRNARTGKSQMIIPLDRPINAMTSIGNRMWVHYNRNIQIWNDHYRVFSELEHRHETPVHDIVYIENNRTAWTCSVDAINVWK